MLNLSNRNKPTLSQIMAYPFESTTYYSVRIIGFNSDTAVINYSIVDTDLEIIECLDEPGMIGIMQAHLLTYPDHIIDSLSFSQALDYIKYSQDVLKLGFKPSESMIISRISDEDHAINQSMSSCSL